MSKKNDILNKKQGKDSFELSSEEKAQVASLMNLVTQAQMAQDYIYTGIVNSIATRLELSDKNLSLNFDEINKTGIDSAKIIVE